MVGIVVVAHGDFAQRIIELAEHVVGAPDYFGRVSCFQNDNMEAHRDEIRDAIVQRDDGNGVVILTDLLGGTSNNLALSLFKEGKVEIISGVNLPQMIRAAGVALSDLALEEAVRAFASWLFRKLDVFVEEAAKSAGKAAGVGLIGGVTYVAFEKNFGLVLDFLKSLI